MLRYSLLITKEANNLYTALLSKALKCSMKFYFIEAARYFYIKYFMAKIPTKIL